ncbi:MULTISPECIES: hypothetical protein [unclassified Lactococcus]|uniref:hypothetical protein n=1 Tax=unclassified Lactococcus TaxID=2643510 RepID=UPI0011CAFE9E|nr:MULTISPECIES: hypothetical protein [unclassified Lactococcus]MQW22006.1 hypothetical protein [Lactococcus sp. dk101]TXK36814.1 hypothetical protein FVP42_10585 [Lactococcus sp. dk310]TXK47489.1 hypothetical protein FVP43_10260 [Lactococcus sp. dk322]
MAIKKYTFFSPDGNNFPITANSDAKLYQMLGGMTDFSTFKAKHWTDPSNTALNRVYNNTSLIVGGRYFELDTETLTLAPNATNYIHANINLSETLDPVSLSVETADNSNTIDINNSSGILKRCFEVVSTSASSVSTATLRPQVTKLDQLQLSNDTNDWINLTPKNGFSGNLKYRIFGGVLFVRAYALTCPAVAANTVVTFATIPGVNTSYITHSWATAANFGSGLYVSYPCMVIGDSNGNLIFARDAALPSGYKLSGSASCPL